MPLPSPAAQIRALVFISLVALTTESTALASVSSTQHDVAALQGQYLQHMRRLGRLAGCHKLNGTDQLCQPVSWQQVASTASVAPSCNSHLTSYVRCLDEDRSIDVLAAAQGWLYKHGRVHFAQLG